MLRYSAFMTFVGFETFVYQELTLEIQPYDLPRTTPVTMPVEEIEE